MRQTLRLFNAPSVASRQLPRVAGEHALGLLPGDIVVWRYGRTFAHGGIVTGWPMVVHAFAPYRFVAETDVSRPSELTLLNDGKPRPMRSFRLHALK